MLLTLLLLLSGLLLTGYSLVILFRRRRLLSASISGTLGLLLTLSGGIAGLLLLNIQTYQQLTREVVLAQISITPRSDGVMQIHLVSSQLDGVYPVASDEWRLDARFLKWKPWFSLLGKDPLVRLESLEERGGRAGPGHALKHYDLVSGNSWMDNFISEMSRHMGLIDSVYGSSVYMPVRDGARYKVTASLSGLVARPVNPPARQAVMEWSSH